MRAANPALPPIRGAIAPDRSVPQQEKTEAALCRQHRIGRDGCARR